MAGSEVRRPKPSRPPCRLAHGRKGYSRVLHRCDNRLCVEPGHLFTGTHQENMDDMAAKGRRTAQPGALNGNARLTPEQVAEIRTNSRSHRSLGLEYGVSKTTIGRIKRGTMWQPKGSALREWPS